jgi:hypothetical protein
VPAQAKQDLQLRLASAAEVGVKRQNQCSNGLASFGWPLHQVTVTLATTSAHMHVGCHEFLNPAGITQDEAIVLAT